ncbi:MAG: glycosyltransferase family 4 protein [Actinomycetota bacterium]|nr:glycosyltransferase family 4 protein [Actinomycetota bacterium]
MRVIYDVRGAQTRHHAERGIPRYIVSSVAALARRSELIDLHVLIDEELPVPARIVGALPAQRLVTLDGLSRLLEGEDSVIHHIGSTFELDWTRPHLLPAALDDPRVIRAATVFDALPVTMPETFVPWTREPWYARWCRYRADVIETADLVPCISDFSAAEAVRTLAVDERRVRVVGIGVPAPTPDDGAPLDVPGLEARFVLYSGGAEHPRKNIERLVSAFGLLEERLRRTHQLVIASRMAPEVRARLLETAGAAGVGERLLLAGFVEDEVLARLYARCACFAYPSLYEGFGLPIAEAMSHGAPVVASATTACGDVVDDPRAAFDPEDEADIARVLTRVLSDPALAAELGAGGRDRAGSYTWERVAEALVAAYEASA